MTRGQRLDLTDLPADPLERLALLLHIEDEIRAEVENAYASAYFDARLTGQLEVAIDQRRHARKKILAMTRRVNFQRGSSVRWADGLDPLG